MELRYGKNIPQDGVTESVDTRDVVTRIYPLAYNGYAMGGNGCVDSPVIDSYPTVRTRTMTFNDVKMRADAQDSDAENGTTICETQEQLDAALKERCDAQYSAGLDKPTVTITADMVLLENTNQYRDYAALERVSLGDTVHCIHSRLGITTQERVIELTYDCIGQKVTGVVLGQKSTNYFDKVSGTISRVDSAIRSDGTVIADQVTGRLNAALAQLVGQYNIAEKQDVMAILFENLDETSEMFGALAIGTQGILISKQRTADGKDWVWTTAISYAGIMADVIVSGRMQTKDGQFYIDLDKGESTATTLISSYSNYSDNLDLKTMKLQMKNWITEDGEFEKGLAGLILSMNGEDIFSVSPPILENSAISISAKTPSGQNVNIMFGDTTDIYATSHDDVPEGFYPVAARVLSLGDKESRIYSDVFTVFNDLTVDENLMVRGSIVDGLRVEGNLMVTGNLRVSGDDKQRLVETSQGMVGINAYETAEPYFGDIGEAWTDENGQVRIDIDPLFAETVNTSCPYQVFLQPYCSGDFYVVERTETYFVVKGNPNSAFGYEIKAKQKGNENKRLEKIKG